MNPNPLRFGSFELLPSDGHCGSTHALLPRHLRQFQPAGDPRRPPSPPLRSGLALRLRRNPIRLGTLDGWGRPLKGGAGTDQIDIGKVTLHPQRGRFRCERRRRTTVRSGPTTAGMAWRCAGDLVSELEAGDDVDLRLLDGEYAMLRVAEHSSPAPHAAREKIGNQIQGEGRQLNALVCTPALELGVDIGALDTVLMRNVPPTAAIDWQRTGRAGRRHRIAVEVTYAKSTVFDQSYFRELLKLVRGQVEPPPCNFKNEVYLDGMAGHIHGNDNQAEKDRAIRARLDSKGCEVVVIRSFELDDKHAVVVALVFCTSRRRHRDGRVHVQAARG